jgi:hypothetical protein
MHRARVNARPEFRKPMDALVRVLPGEKQAWVILCQVMTLIHTHYNGITRRSYPCTSADPDRCIWDHRYSRCQLAGWLAVQRAYESRVRFLALTEAAIRDNPALWNDEKSLRGREIYVGRAGRDSQSRMYAILGFPVPDARRLLAEPDCKTFLVNLFGPPGSWPLNPDRCDPAAINPVDFWRDLADLKGGAK